MRGTVKKIINREEYKAPATIDDPVSLTIIEEEAKKWLDARDAAKKAEEAKHVL